MPTCPILSGWFRPWIQKVESVSSPHLTERQTYCQHLINKQWYKVLGGNLWSTPGHPFPWHGSLGSDRSGCHYHWNDGKYLTLYSNWKGRGDAQNLYARNHQLNMELCSEKNNFFSLLVRDSKIVHSFWWNLERYTEKDLHHQYPSVFLQGIRCSLEN